MSKDSYYIKSGTYTLLQRVATTIFGVLIFAMLTRVMDKDAYGVFMLFSSVTALIEVARNGLIQNALIKFGATCEEDEFPEVINASLTLNIILSVVSALGILLIAPYLAKTWKHEEMIPMLNVYCISLIVLIPFTQFNFLQQSMLDFKGIFYSTIVRQGILFMMILIFVIIGRNINLVELAWVQVAGASLASIISYFFVRKYLKISRKISWPWVSKLFHYGKYVFGTNLSSMIFSSIDQYMLGSLMTTSIVATYSVAIRIVSLVDIPISTVVAVVFPQSARIKEGDKEEIKNLYEKSIGFMLAIIVPVVFFCMLIPGIILEVLAGSKYTDPTTANITRIMLLTTVLMPFIRQYGTMLDSTNKPHWNFMTILGIAGLNAGMNYWLIQAIPDYGAAIATLSSMAVFFIIARVVLGKMFGIRFTPTLKYFLKFYQEAGTYISLQFNNLSRTK